MNLTPYTCRAGRSPLISLMFPTIKDKITDLSRSKAIQSLNRTIKPKYLDNGELERLVSIEMRQRNQLGRSLQI